MKKLMKFLCSTIFCIIVVLGMPQMVRAEEVAINETNFPDNTFRYFILDHFDSDKNEILSDNEIQSVITIDIESENLAISDLKGIEHFKFLKKLICRTMFLTELDVSHNILLEHLECNGYVGNDNTLPELDVSNNTALKYLSCDANNLTKLDISNNTLLKVLSCDYNDLTELNVSKNVLLESLSCDSNNLIELDINNNLSLTKLNCWSNNLTELNISNNTLLEILHCNSNKITELDVSHNTTLRILGCYNNNLTKLDINQNSLLESLYCHSNDLTKLDISKNVVLEDLDCAYNKITMLKINKLSYNKLELEKNNLHGENSILSYLSNVKEEDGIIKVIDITKPGTYQYSSCYIDNGIPINFTILYSDTKNDDENNFVIPYCNKIFSDYEYKNLVSGTAIVLYGNCKKNTDTIQKDCILYTDILASYNYSVDSKGKVKTSTGKVIVGITMSDIKPTITKNKIVDNEAAKIAKAKIKNGQITVTATGKAGGVVYLWIMDTGNKGVSECCPINVKLAPKKLEVQETTGSKANKLKIVNGTSKEVKIAGFVGTTKTEDCTYTATIASNSQSYVSVTTLDNKNFTLKGTGLKNDKDTKVSITFTCKENGKKIKFTATITKPTT